MHCDLAFGQLMCPCCLHHNCRSFFKFGLVSNLPGLESRYSPHPHQSQPAKPLSGYLDFWQAQPSAPLNVHAPPFVPSAFSADGGVYKVISSYQSIFGSYGLEPTCFSFVPDHRSEKSRSSLFDVPSPLLACAAAAFEGNGRFLCVGPPRRIAPCNRRPHRKRAALEGAFAHPIKSCRSFNP